MGDFRKLWDRIGIGGVIILGLALFFLPRTNNILYRSHHYYNRYSNVAGRLVQQPKTNIQTSDNENQ